METADIFTFYNTYSPQTLDTIIVNKKQSMQLYKYILNIKKTVFKCFILYSDYNGCGKHLSINIISSLLKCPIIHGSSIVYDNIIEILSKKQSISSFFTKTTTTSYIILNIDTLTPSLIQYLTLYSKTIQIPIIITMLSSVFLKKYKTFAHCIFFKKPLKKHLFNITIQLIHSSLSLLHLNSINIKKIISRISSLSMYNIDTLYSICYNFNIYCKQVPLSVSPFLFFETHVLDRFLLLNGHKKNKRKTITKKTLLSYNNEQQHLLLSHHSEYYKNRCFDYFCTSSNIHIEQCYELNEHLSFIDTLYNTHYTNSSYYYYYINEYCILKPIKESFNLLNKIL
jgi:hypothetical protein